MDIFTLENCVILMGMGSSTVYRLLPLWIGDTNEGQNTLFSIASNPYIQNII